MLVLGGCHRSCRLDDLPARKVSGARAGDVLVYSDGVEGPVARAGLTYSILPACASDSETQNIKRS